MRQVTGFAALMGVSAFMVCAAQTPATSSTPAPASQAPATTTAAATPAQTKTPAAATSTSASTAASDSAPKKPFKKPWGYEQKTVNGQDVYCKKDPVPGSRTERHEVCLTQQELEARSDSSRDYMQQVQRTGGLVSGQGGGLPAGGMGR